MTTEFKQIMIDNNLTDKDVIEHLGISERTVRRYKSGDIDPKKHVIIALKNISLIKQGKAS